MKHILHNYENDTDDIIIEAWDGNDQIVTITVEGETAKFSASVDDLYRIGKLLHEKKEDESHPHE